MSFDIADPTFNQSVSAVHQIYNYAGTFGSYLAGFLVDFFGLAAYIWAIFFLVMGIKLVVRWFAIPWYSFMGYIMLSGCFISFSEAFRLGIGDVQGGGIFGAWLYATSHEYFNPLGSIFIWLFTLLLGTQLCFQISWFNFFGKIFQETAKTTVIVGKKIPKSLPTIKKFALEKFALPKNETKELPQNLDTKTSPKKENSKENTSIVAQNSSPLKEDIKKVKEDIKKVEEIQTENLPKKRGIWNALFSSEDLSQNDKKNLPSIDLLSPIPENREMPSTDNLVEKGEKLIRCLEDFNVMGKLSDIATGPVVTMFEIRPDRGVKAKRFEVLANDIAMAIKAIAVRVQAPIPGTDTVGIEVPNDIRQTVSFREIIQSESFSKSTSVLSLGLGKDIFGTPVTVKMEDMPHLLVAGSTGAGKSVCLNSIILSILYKAMPHEVKLLLIDPKRVELAMYADLPHLVHPVVTDMDLAKNALLWAIDEMDQRYQLFQNNHVRNFTEYNNLINKNVESKNKLSFETSKQEDAPTKKLPYVVIIIDELADLMMQKGKEVEAGVVRLAQLARAAGIHLIIATQRPSVDVVTGLIKANFPSRIAFQVTSGIDSRTILDTVGAEALLGKGDMLFKPRSGPLQRMHGAFVTDSEVRDVVAYWKNYAQPEYTVDFTQYGASQNSDPYAQDQNYEHDPMYDTILEKVLDAGEASISMLQRNFRLGFGRAGRIVDQLEREGIIGPPSGSKPRKVIR